MLKKPLPLILSALLAAFTVGGFLHLANATPGDEDPPRRRTLTVPVQKEEAWTQQTAVDYEAAQEKLLKRISVERGQADFKEILKEIEEKAGLQLHVNWGALELVGIDADTLVEVSFTDVSAKLILEAVLKNVSAEQFEDDKAGFANQYGIIQISTRFDLRSLVETRYYDVGQLLREPYRPIGLIYDEDAFDNTLAFRAWARDQRSSPFTDALLIDAYKSKIEQMQRELTKLEEEVRKIHLPEQDDGEAVGGGGGGGGGFGGGLFGDDEKLDEPSKVDAIDDLAQLIKTQVGDPSEWLDQTSTIRFKGTTMIVDTHQGNHAEIEDLLNVLIQSELEDQVSVIRDAEVCRLIFQATKQFEQGNTAAALELIDRALLIDPDHLPANAMHQVYSGMIERE